MGLHYFSSSRDQSFAGPTCRKLTLRFALRTCRYLDAVDLLTRSSLAISAIELLGLSPREWTVLSSIMSRRLSSISNLAVNSECQLCASSPIDLSHVLPA